jgi:hypothetical protein
MIVPASEGITKDRSIIGIIILVPIDNKTIIVVT